MAQYMNRTFGDRVSENTDADIQREIDESILANVEYYKNREHNAISARIRTLEEEWDIERVLETNASSLALSGVILSRIGSSKWLFLSAGVLSFLLQHAIQGWCPPLTILRRLGVRTRQEIDRERYALKALRGDFGELPYDKNDADFAEKLIQAVAS